MSQNNANNGNSKRWILIVSCVVLAILCLLLIPQFCSNGGSDPYETQLEEIQQQLQRQQEDLIRIQKDIEEQRRVIIIQQQQVQKLIERIERLNRDWQQIKNEIDKIRREIEEKGDDQTIQQLLVMQRQLDQQQQFLQYLRNEIGIIPRKDLDPKWIRILQDEDDKIQKLVKEIDNLRREIRKCTPSDNESQQSLQDLQRQLTDAENKLRDLQRDIDDLQRQINNGDLDAATDEQLQKNCNDQKLKIEQLEGSIDQIKKRIKTIENKSSKGGNGDNGDNGKGGSGGNGNGGNGDNGGRIEPLPIPPTPDPVDPSGLFESIGGGAIIALVIALIVLYIIARVKSSHGEMKITANSFDKFLLIGSPIVFFIGVLVYDFNHEWGEILVYIAGIMFLVSLGFSIQANLGSVWHMALSIIAKIFIFVSVFIIEMVILFLFIVRLFNRSDTSETYVVKYDHFLNEWVGYRVD